MSGLAEFMKELKKIRLKMQLAITAFGRHLAQLQTITIVSKNEPILCHKMYS